MALGNRKDTRILRRSRGYQALADDGRLGEVETPLLPAGADEPDFLVIRVRGWLRTRLPVVSTALVVDVDTTNEVVRIAGPRDRLRRLPEYLPLSI